VICQTKTIQISTYNYNLLAESILYSFTKLFFTKCSKRVNLPNFISAKPSCYTVIDVTHIAAVAHAFVLNAPCFSYAVHQVWDFA